MKEKWKITKSITIPQEKIPESINLNDTIKQFKKHSYHLGATPTTSPKPTPIPPVEKTTHVIKDVSLSDGDLNITFEFINNVYGNKIMKDYDQNHDYKMIPIIDKDEKNIVRFDLVKNDVDF